MKTQAYAAKMYAAILTYLLKVFRQIRKSPSKSVLFLLALSFLVRLLVVLPLDDFQPKFDEKAYYKQAVGYHEIFKSALNLQAPQKEDFLKAYNHGGFLPFNSILIALGFLIFSEKIIVARLIIIMISSFTTLLVFVLTAKLINSQAAFYAALLHVFYPSFVSFSHLLWSETSFIFFLMLILYITIIMSESRETKKLFALSVALGFFLGLLALTRGSAIPFLLFFPLWFACINKKKFYKIFIPITIISSFMITALPWEYILFKMENKFVLLSTIGNQFMLYRYNNSHVRKGLMYASRDDMRAAQLALQEYSLKNNIPILKAAMSLFIKEITSHFPAFVKRTFENFLALWTFDLFPLRHIFNLVYPPWPNLLILIIFFIFLLGHSSLIFLAIIGFLAKEPPFRKKVLVLGMVVAGMLPYLITQSHTRYNLPQIALLLPFAGYGVEKLKQSKHVLIILSVVFSGLFAVYCHTYNNSIYKELRPSSYYYNILRYPSQIFSKIEYKDQLILKPIGHADGDTIVIKIIAKEHYKFFQAKHEDSLQVHIKNAPITVTIVSANPDMPLLLEIYSETENKAIQISPIAKKKWQKEQEVFPGKLKLIWTGGF